jgi:hypothetical protein
MDQDNIEYLERISDRVEYYYSIRKKAIRYIMDNQIRDAELGINLVLMSAIWAAHQRKEEMTEDNLLILFGLSKAEEEEEFLEKSVLLLQPEHHELTLNEIFDQTVESFNQ